MNDLEAQPTPTTEMSEQYLCDAGQVPHDSGLRVETVGSPAIAVFRVGDGFRAIDDLCTHGDASLAEGYVEDGVVECPWHAGRFDLCTGEPLSAPCLLPVRTHALVLRGAAIYRIFPVPAV